MSDTIGTDSAPHAGPIALPSPCEDDERCYGGRYCARDGGRCLGEGGFGRVIRARDTSLDRFVAIKVLRGDRAHSDVAVGRFRRELMVMSRLRHPGIVPIYDAGEVEGDGRPWYAMPIVNRQAPAQARARQNRPLDARVHIERLARVAETVAYAHSRGVVHGDLSPDNIMYGDLGEVFVMDWGLARGVDVDRRVPPPADGDERTIVGDRSLTHNGGMAGKPPYMSLEQARGEPGRMSPVSDVYALGAILYQLLWGSRPAPYHPNSGRRAIRWVTDGAPMAEMLPTLVTLCKRAMAREPSARPSAERFAERLRGWLNHEERRVAAAAVLLSAERDKAGANAARRRAKRHAKKARKQLKGVRQGDHYDKKEQAWSEEDKAAEALLAAEMADARAQNKARAAQITDPTFELPVAEIRTFHQVRLTLAEQREDRGTVAFHEETLRTLGGSARFLAGTGRLSLNTRPSNAHVVAQRYEECKHRLQLLAPVSLGSTPLRQIPMEMGSYLLTIKATGHHAVRYPVHIRRGQHWHGRPPGSRKPWPILLPTLGELGPDDRYVPAGWTTLGGDEAALDALPMRRIWMDGFVMRRYPVTQEEFAKLIVLVAEQDVSEAAKIMSREPSTRGRATDRDGVRQAIASPFDDDGCWRPHWPVCDVSSRQADRYARWIARLEGLPWRLPHEFEREKAARGVDARFFPWGRYAEPSFCRVAESHLTTPRRMNVTARRLDISPYGIVGLAGNVRDICSSYWEQSGPAVAGNRVDVSKGGGTSSRFRSVRGGAWSSPILNARAAARYILRTGDGRAAIGFRLVRSFPCAGPRGRGRH